jgi:hypothetical protein
MFIIVLLFKTKLSSRRRRDMLSIAAQVAIQQEHTNFQSPHLGFYKHSAKPFNPLLLLANTFQCKPAAPPGRFLVPRNDSRIFAFVQSQSFTPSPGIKFFVEYLQNILIKMRLFFAPPPSTGFFHY